MQRPRQRCDIVCHELEEVKGTFVGSARMRWREITHTWSAWDFSGVFGAGQ